MLKEQHIEQEIKRPSAYNFIAEHFRVWKDLRKGFVFRKSYEINTKGDGHPVLVIPGFMGSPLSTGLLRKFIRQLGYAAYDWDLGRNFGDISQLNIIQKKIEDLQIKHNTPVSVIGWSLGGVYARQLAKENPERIRQVITLGSPFAGINKPNNAAWLFKLINKKKTIAKADEKWVQDVPAPAPVPTTAIYSKNDGIVPWQTCIEQKPDELHQNIEVKGSHLGMGYNPSIWVVVEDRLQYSMDNWKHFEKPEVVHPLVEFPSLKS